MPLATENFGFAGFRPVDELWNCEVYRLIPTADFENYNLASTVITGKSITEIHIFGHLISFIIIQKEPTEDS